MSARTQKTILTLIFLIIGVFLQWRAHPAAIRDALSTVESTPSPSLPQGFVYVIRAVDGDTIELADGQRVRYLGMDTPETVNPKKPVQCYGPEASAFNHHLVDGAAVRLVRDIEDTDKYGRLLRYVYLPDGTFVNQALVAGGYATVYTWPPNIAHTADFKTAQAKAQATGRGLWSACPHSTR